MRATRSVLMIALALGPALGGCDRRAELTKGPVDSPPKQFQQLADKFKNKAGMDRLAKARDLERVLPSCPVTFSNRSFMGHIIARDYSRPSYRLTKEQIIAALGRPHSINMDDPFYAVLYDLGTTDWFLSIEVRNDYAVDSMVYQANPTKKRSLPTSEGSEDGSARLKR